MSNYSQHQRLRVTFCPGLLLKYPDLKPDNIKQKLLLFKTKTNDEAKESTFLPIHSRLSNSITAKADPSELDIQFQVERERQVQR